MFTAINALYMLCVLLEPFMPSFSAKVYEQLAIERILEHETIIGQYKVDPTILTRLVKTGHKIGKVGPIIKEIPITDADKWKASFGGKGTKPQDQ
jgi:methionyl-tRNA synthetase